MRPGPQSLITGITPPICRVRIRSIPITRRLNSRRELIFSSDNKLVRIAISIPVASAATSVIEIISSISVKPLVAWASARSVGFRLRPLVCITAAHPPPAKPLSETLRAKSYASLPHPSSRFQARYDPRPTSPAALQEPSQTAESPPARSKARRQSAPHQNLQPWEHYAVVWAPPAVHPFSIWPAAPPDRTPSAGRHYAPHPISY